MIASALAPLPHAIMEALTAHNGAASEETLRAAVQAAGFAHAPHLGTILEHLATVDLIEARDHFAGITRYRTWCSTGNPYTLATPPPARSAPPERRPRHKWRTLKL